MQSFSKREVATHALHAAEAALGLPAGVLGVPSLVDQLTRGDGPVRQAQFFWGIAAFAWLAAEAFGGKRAQVWPASGCPAKDDDASTGQPTPMA